MRNTEAAALKTASREPYGMRYGILSNKGGVGRTTTVRELLAALARKGYRVLGVDMDPQANLTRRMAVQVTGLTLSDILLQDVVRKGSLAPAIHTCGWSCPEAELIDVIPSDLRLGDLSDQAAKAGFESRLRFALAGVTDDYDFVLVDCRPNLQEIERLVVASLDGDADGILVVMEPNQDAIRGASRAIEQRDEWVAQLGMDPGPPVVGAVVNKVRVGTTLHEQRTEQIPTALAVEDFERPGELQAAPPVLAPHIRLATRLEFLHDTANPISTDAEAAKLGLVEAYDTLAEEFVQIALSRLGVAA